MEIGGRPILWHVIQIYAAHGFRRFLLLTGYKRELIEEFVDLSEWPAGVELECLDTGLETPTGGRVAAVSERLRDGTFALTYADGVADVDLRGALSFHRGHGDAATVTLVRPHSQWGVAALDGEDRVREFAEKPRMDQWVNGGFFFMEPEALGYIEDGSVLEREPLQRLVADGRLHGFRHSGFWDCMDTYKDAVLLNDLWESGQAPWRTWDRAGTR